MMTQLERIGFHNSTYLQWLLTKLTNSLPPMSFRSNDDGVYWIPCLQWVLCQKILEYTEFLDSNDHVTTAQWVYWFPEGQLESRLNSYLEYTEFLTLHDILNSLLRVYHFPAYHYYVLRLKNLKSSLLDISTSLRLT